MSTELRTVHVRISDAATDQPTPVRIRFVGPDGRYFAPLGRVADFPTEPNVDVGGNVMVGGARYAYIDGTCEVRLPAGPLRLEVSKGPEYVPEAFHLTLGPGQIALRRNIRRWIDLRAEGWYSGDGRAHGLTPHAALLEGMAEDLAVVNLLVRQTPVRATQGTGQSERSGTSPGESSGYTTFPNILAFSGQQAALEAAGYQVVVNSLNSHTDLGSVALLNCHRTVFPLHAERHSGDDTTVADWCDQCHRKGGLTVWTGVGQPSDPVADPHGELLADLVLGKIDALEVSDGIPRDPWYTFLSAGCRLPLLGSSLKENNASVLGGVRTYARLLPDQEFTFQNWIEAVRSGRTFATAGPLLEFTVNGQGAGAVIDVVSSNYRVHVKAKAHGYRSFDTLAIVFNGVPREVARASGSPPSAELETELTVPKPGWVAAVCDERRVREDGKEHWVPVAHSSPVYCRFDGRSHIRAEAVGHLLGALHRFQRRVREWGSGEHERGPRRVLRLVEEARAVLLQRLGH
jgi:hypothetical protein